MTTVLIKNGVYRNKPVHNASFKLVKEFKKGAIGGFVTVDSAGFFGPEFDVVRIKVAAEADIELGGVPDQAPALGAVATHVAKALETDEEVMTRIEKRFDMLDDMTKAAIAGNIRALIVVGPPGVGKSYGIQYQLEKAGIFEKISGKKIKYEIVKGATTAIGLYCTLYKNSDAKNILVFDDCDSIYYDDDSLNILKAALDSGKKRRISWNSDSKMLRREGVPSTFEFKGSIIFITNLKFDNVRSKKLQDHLAALQSRCHFLDLTLDTTRDKFLRIKQIFNKGDLFQDYEFSKEVGEEILAYMLEKKDKLREMSLRVALKIADLTHVSEKDWKTYADTTICKAND